MAHKKRLLLGSLTYAIPTSPSLDSYVSSTLPPLTFTPQGAEIDYSLLLFADHLSFDKDSVEFLAESPEPVLRGIAQSILFLREEGLLDLLDSSEITSRYRGKIDRAAAHAVNSPEIWLPGIRDHIRKYAAIRSPLRVTLGACLSNWDDQTFAVGNYLQRKYGKVNPGTATRLKNVIMNKEISSMSEGELDDIKGVIEETIKGVSGQILIASEDGSHNFCWKTYDHIFSMLAEISPRAGPDVETHARACRDFFRVAFPDFAPRTQAEWMRLITHKQVAQLKNRIGQAVAAGEALDAEFATRELAALLAKQDKANGRKTWIGRGLAAASMSAGAGLTLATQGVPLLAELLIGAGAAGIAWAAQELSNISADREASNEHAWMYFTTTKS